MKQEHVTKILSLLMNYVSRTNEEFGGEFAATSTIRLLAGMKAYSEKPLSDREKSNMISDTIFALNCGSKEAEEDAFDILLKALTSGDDELIEKIMYLHSVI